VQANILPKTALGKWSTGLVVAAILFFALGGLLFPFEPSDPRFNPILALAVIGAVCFCLLEHGNRLVVSDSDSCLTSPDVLLFVSLSQALKLLQQIFKLLVLHRT